jgi:phosphoglycerate-specific signal transduction histidine kinase
MTQPDRPLLYINAMRGLSHELRNALTAVAGFSDLLQARMQDDTDRFMLKQVQDGAARIHTMLDAVARFTVRPGQGASPVDLSQSVKDAWELAVWQHRGNMATAMFDLSSSQTVALDAIVCHEFLLFLFGQVLEFALHTAPVAISLISDGQNGILLTVSWVVSEERQAFEGFSDMVRELGAEMRAEPGRVSVVFRSMAG